VLSLNFSIPLSLPPTHTHSLTHIHTHTHKYTSSPSSLFCHAKSVEHANDVLITNLSLLTIRRCHLMTSRRVIIAMTTKKVFKNSLTFIIFNINASEGNFIYILQAAFEISSRQKFTKPNCN